MRSQGCPWLADFSDAIIIIIIILLPRLGGCGTTGLEGSDGPEPAEIARSSGWLFCRQAGFIF